MDLIEPSFVLASFTRNRQRLLELDVAARFLDEVVGHVDTLQLLNDEHFTVDRTLIEAASSLKSLRLSDAAPAEPTDDPGNPTATFLGKKRSNATQVSTTDPYSRLAKKSAGKDAKLCFTGRALRENRHGLLVDFEISTTSGTEERDATSVLLETAQARVPSAYRRRGQGIGHQSVGDGGADAGGQTAPRAEPSRHTVACDRWANDLSSGVHHPPAQSQGGGRDLRVDENGGRVPADQVSRIGADAARRVVGRHRLQPRANGPTGDDDGVPNHRITARPRVVVPGAVREGTGEANSRRPNHQC